MGMSMRASSLGEGTRLRQKSSYAGCASQRLKIGLGRPASRGRSRNGLPLAYHLASSARHQARVPGAAIGSAAFAVLAADALGLLAAGALALPALAACELPAAAAPPESIAPA